MVFIDFHGTLCHDLFWRSLPPDKRNRLALRAPGLRRHWRGCFVARDPRPGCRAAPNLPPSLPRRIAL